MPLTLRLVAPADRPQWERLWQGYQTFYQVDLGAAVTDTAFARILDPAEPVFCIGAFDGEAMIGFATCIVHRSPWLLTNDCLLKDLFVDPAVRGTGAGRRLIEAASDEAHRRGAERMHWLTHETNATARRLYDRLAQNRGFIAYSRPLP